MKSWAVLSGKAAENESLVTTLACKSNYVVCCCFKSAV